MEKAQEVRDWQGRAYLVGDTPQDLINRPRSWMLWLPWAAMIAIAPLQYGYAAALPGLLSSAGRSVAGALVPLAVWIVFQAVVALPTAYLVRGGRLDVRAALRVGAVLSGAAMLTVAFSDGTAAIRTGYALLGGAGAGLVYGVCTETVARWFPERPGTHVGFATGAFAYGAAPLAVVAGLGSGGGVKVAFGVSGVLALAVIGLAAHFVRLPPRRWWPPHLDPREHALDSLVLRRTPPALREFSTGQALRTGASTCLAVILICAGAVSIFDVVAVATLERPVPWVALTLLIALNGAGRACAMLASERFGRRRVLSTVLALLAVGQLLFSAGVAAESGGLVLMAAVFAGLGGGAFYPLIASLVREFFGQERTAEIHSVVYSTKAVAGALGVAVAYLAITSANQPTVFLAMGAVAIVSLIVSHRLRRPGRPTTLPASV
ncbi:MFS transporter [Planotetraspora thailandica]|uniref:MFS transporter n=1 Tax=Planotetraspora thailandica TaxID=487172 RepID=A0A8J3XZY3_9ACTN|nr:MFS transporter [Planotetraspora thailandica]GII58249.1 MFS transporter [Planotetraspora thailandica]